MFSHSPIFTVLVPAAEIGGTTEGVTPAILCTAARRPPGQTAGRRFIYAARVSPSRPYPAGADWMPSGGSDARGVRTGLETIPGRVRAW